MSEQAPLYQWLAKSVPRKTLSPVYLCSLFSVALAMILLPVCYVALCVLGVWLVYEEVIFTYPLCVWALEHLAFKMILGYVFVLMAEVFALVSLLKPFFFQPHPTISRLKITRESEPVLYQFIEETCDCVGAPRPAMVYVDSQINAAAGIENGFWGIMGDRLELTIGLPLAHKLTVAQFGGVLAHEFGHFTQPLAMRLSCVIRSINHGFSQIVSQNEPSFGFSFLSRRVLWFLMLTGQAVSSYLMRQMEFDADRCERLVVGHKEFSETFIKFEMLSRGSRQAIRILNGAIREGKLLDNLPLLTHMMTEQLPADSIKAIKESVFADKTPASWFSTHPSNYERLSYPCADGNPILVGDQSAAALFSNFERLCKDISLGDYLERYHLKFDLKSVLPTVPYLETLNSNEKKIETVRAFFGGIISNRLLAYPQDEAGTPEETDGFEDAEEAQTQLKHFQNLETKLYGLIAIQESLILQMPINPPPEEAVNPEEIAERISELSIEIQESQIPLRAFQQRRMQHLIRLAQKSQTAPNDSERREFLLSFLTQMAPIDEIIQSQGETRARAKVIFDNLKTVMGDVQIVNRLRTRCSDLRLVMNKVDVLASNIPFPMRDPRYPNLARYLATPNLRNDVREDFYGFAELEAKFSNLYFQVLIELFEVVPDLRNDAERTEKRETSAGILEHS